MDRHAELDAVEGKRGIVTEVSLEPRVGMPEAPVVSPHRSHGVLWFLARRLAAALVTLFVVSILVFAGTEILPGDAAEAILGQSATPDAVSQIRAELNLNRPATTRYLDWLSHIVRGDLGISATQTFASGGKSPIWPLISGPLVNSLILALFTVILLIPIGLGLGVYSATRAGRPSDHAISVSSLGAISLPEFVVGPIFIVIFAVWLKQLPGISLVPSGTSVFSNPKILVLPVATLLAVSLAWTIRMVRACMLDVLGSEFIVMARLNGLPERKVIYRYGLRNALAPTIQVIALNIQWLVGGIIVTETVFGYPGIGQTLVEVVNSRDIPFVQAVCMILAAFYLLVNIVADLLVVLLVPKLRTAL
jgi:peptide/nickel transport system permease protein